jgi:D-alanine-D-alanine ligase
VTGSSRPASRVVVLMGGPSAEREVSLSTGRGCAEALRSEGYEVIEVDAGPDLASRLVEMPDVVFNALHGRWGEDGCVQGILEWLRIPYTHSGVLASALAMDKARTKDAYRVPHGLPVVDSVIRPQGEVEARHVMAPPYVVKPNNEGSSVGVYLVHGGRQRAAEAGPGDARARHGRGLRRGARADLFRHGHGRGRSRCAHGDRYPDRWLVRLHAKYAPGGSRHVVPAEVPAEIFDACMDYSARAHHALGCRGVSRTDFRWDEAKGLAGLILLETNTQPGMTPTSLTPEQAEAKGMSFGALCRWLVEDASCDR